MIGYYGEILFECSEQKMLTPSKWSRSGSSRWQDYDLLQRKPVSSFGGPALEKISFTIILDVNMGVNPEIQLRRLRKIRDEGEVYPLVLNNEMITQNYWRLDDIKESDNYFTGDGQLMRSEADLSLTEYSMINEIEAAFREADILRWL